MLIIDRLHRQLEHAEAEHARIVGLLDRVLNTVSDQRAIMRDHGLLPVKGEVDDAAPARRLQ